MVTREWYAIIMDKAEGLEKCQRMKRLSENIQTFVSMAGQLRNVGC